MFKFDDEEEEEKEKIIGKNNDILERSLIGSNQKKLYDEHVLN